MRSQETMGGRILLLTCTGGYVQALDTGGFCVGQPREEGKLSTCSLYRFCSRVWCLVQVRALRLERCSV